MLASTIVVLLHFPFVLVFVVVFFHPLVHVVLVVVLLSVSGLCISFSCGAIVICVRMLCAFVRCVLAICAIVCCSVCMHAVVQCFALVRGVDSVAIFIVPCAFFCPEHVCGCSLSDVCVCVSVVWHGIESVVLVFVLLWSFCFRLAWNCFCCFGFRLALGCGVRGGRGAVTRELGPSGEKGGVRMRP